jgi:cell division protein FtsX
MSSDPAIVIPLILAISGTIYFFPTIVGLLTRHHSRFVLFVLNLTLGWTVFAWCLLLAWAIIGRRTSETSLRRFYDINH